MGLNYRSDRGGRRAPPPPPTVHFVRRLSGNRKCHSVQWRQNWPPRRPLNVRVRCDKAGQFAATPIQEKGEKRETDDRDWNCAIKGNISFFTCLLGLDIGLGCSNANNNLPLPLVIDFSIGY